MKKVFKHTMTNWKVLIYDFDKDTIRASFLSEEKPKVGDVIQSHIKRDSNFVYSYQVMSILSQRDSEENNLAPENEHLRKNAHLTMEVELLNKRNGNGTISGEFTRNIGIEVDSSIRNF